MTLTILKGFLTIINQGLLAPSRRRGRSRGVNRPLIATTPLLSPFMKTLLSVLCLACLCISAWAHELRFDQEAAMSSISQPTQAAPSRVLRARPTLVHRPSSREAIRQARLRSLQHEQSEPVQWTPLEVLGPDIEDRHTLAQLSRMSGNAYALPDQKNWYDLDAAWNTVRVNESLR